MPITDAYPITTLEQARERFRELVQDAKLTDEPSVVTVRDLSPEEAIGEGAGAEYALGAGREMMVEARFRDSIGQAFTDEPSNFEGALAEVLQMPLDTNAPRAIFVATANAVLSHLGLVGGTCHCQYPNVRECGWRVASALWSEYAGADVGLIGFQPGFVEGLVEVFSADHVRVADLSPENVGQERQGIMVEDAALTTDELIEASDVLLVTGSAVVNGTLERILTTASRVQVPTVLYGVTAAGPAYLYNLRRVCPLTR